jgi:FkbM family methyltransferase
MAEPTSTPGYKRLIRGALTRASLDVRRLRNIPFGVRWEDDVKYYLDGRPLKVAFDIGAHEGETALMLLETFPGVTVHSFEPMPENHQLLTQAVAGRPVSVVHAAVSDESGSVEMARGDTSFRGSVHGEGPTMTVPAIAIADYVRERGIDRVDLLKIDTEGHEEAVLRGALPLLQDGSTEFVLCECDFTRRPDEPHGDFRAIFEILEPLGYRIVSFYTAGVDNLGWLWGDVLLRYAPGERDSNWASRSPHARRRAR